MKKLAMVIGAVLIVLIAANTGFAAPAGYHGGYHGAYAHHGYYHGYHGGFYGGYGYYGYYPGYRYIGAPYIIGAPGIYVGVPVPRVIIRTHR